MITRGNLWEKPIFGVTPNTRGAAQTVTEFWHTIAIAIFERCGIMNLVECWQVPIGAMPAIWT
jgi:hypothetical protein